MKRLIIAISLAVIGFGAYAGELGLALEQLFDGRYDSNSKVEWSRIKRSGTLNYYLDFNNNPEIIKDVMTALKKDMEGEEFDTEIVTKNETYYKAKFTRNGYIIDIGFSIPKRGRCSLFIRSKREKKDTQSAQSSNNQ